jgi:hypothetical protein
VDNNLLLIEEIHGVINKKLADCDCRPCICTEDTKDEYFQQLKNILTKYNKEYLQHDDTKINLINQAVKQVHYNY